MILTPVKMVLFVQSLLPKFYVVKFHGAERFTAWSVTAFVYAAARRIFGNAHSFAIRTVRNSIIRPAACDKNTDEYNYNPD
jgi:hypothetical protein